jgi:hypothetical protein
MSIQETVVLTREQAEKKLIEKRAWELIVSNLTDEQIEDELDEQFYNYSIK